MVLSHPSVWLKVEPFIAFFLDSRDPFVDANNLIRYQLHMQLIFGGPPRSTWNGGFLCFLAFSFSRCAGKPVPTKGFSLSNGLDSSPRVGLYNHLFFTESVKHYGSGTARGSTMRLA